MNHSLLAACCLLICTNINTHAQMLITGVVDGPLGGGTPKAVELYVSSDIADLSQWGLGSATNGGGSDGSEFVFSGSATAGDYIYLATESAMFNSYFGFAPNFTDGNATNINGDDAIELFFDSTGLFSGSENVIDTFGDINVDGTGQSWEYMDGWAYRQNGSLPGGTVFTESEWLFSGVNALDGTLTNAAAASAFPLGTFTPIPEPKSIALASSVASLLLVILIRQKKKTARSQSRP